MSKPAWKRSSDEARAGGGGIFLRNKNDKGKKEESSDEQTNLTKRRDTHEAFLELGDKDIKNSRKGGAVKSSTCTGVEKGSDISVADCGEELYIGAEPRHVNIEGTEVSLSKAASKKENKNKKNLRQEKNREAKSSKIWPGESASEVKHSKIGPFPLPHTGATNSLEHDEINEVGMKNSLSLVPTSIVFKKTKGCKLPSNKAGSKHSCLSSIATGGRDSDRIDEFDVPQFEGLQQAALASLHDDFDDSVLELTRTARNTSDTVLVRSQDPFAIFEFGPDEDWFKEPDKDDRAEVRGVPSSTPRQLGWEATVVSSVLSQTGSKCSVSGSVGCREDFRPVVSKVRWVEIAHEWSDFEYPLHLLAAC